MEGATEPADVARLRLLAKLWPHVENRGRLPTAVWQTLSLTYRWQGSDHTASPWAELGFAIAQSAVVVALNSPWLAKGHRIDFPFL